MARAENQFTPSKFARSHAKSPAGLDRYGRIIQRPCHHCTSMRGNRANLKTDRTAVIRMYPPTAVGGTGVSPVISRGTGVSPVVFAAMRIPRVSRAVVARF